MNAFANAINGVLSMRQLIALTSELINIIRSAIPLTIAETGGHALAFVQWRVT